MALQPKGQEVIMIDLVQAALDAIEDSKNPYEKKATAVERAKAFALLAIAYELKRANDLKELNNENGH